MICLARWVDFIFDKIIDNNITSIINKKFTYKINDEDTVIGGDKLLIYKICNSITFIASKVIGKHLKKFAITSGIPEKYHDRIHMKSEFLFRKMLLTWTKKRYMSKVMLREGAIFEKTDELMSLILVIV